MKMQKCAMIISIRTGTHQILPSFNKKIAYGINSKEIPIDIIKNTLEIKEKSTRSRLLK